MNLEELYLNGNNFSGGVPEGLYSLTSLKKLFVGNCKLVGLDERYILNMCTRNSAL